MFEARIICSDEDCAEVVEARVRSLDELDGLACDCGYGYVLLSVAELAPA